MPNVKVIDNGNETTLKVTKGEVLSKVLKDNNIDIMFPCGANGRCGKCLVKVISGNAPISSTDENKLSQEQIKEGFRASCRLYVEEDLTVEIEQKNPSLGRSIFNRRNCTKRL